MLFVVAVSAIGNRMVRIAIPVFRRPRFTVSDLHIAGWWNRMYSNEWGQAGVWEVREPAGNIFFVQLKGPPRKNNQRIKNSTPGHMALAHAIIKMSSADEILGQKKSLL